MTCGYGLEEVELECSEAASHLESCCGERPALHGEACRYDRNRCGATMTNCPPELTMDESRLVESLDCDAIQREGYCDLSVLHGSKGSLRQQCLSWTRAVPSDLSVVDAPEDLVAPSSDAAVSDDGDMQ